LPSKKDNNNAMEVSAVIEGLTFLPLGMMVWVSVDSQNVQKGLTEWMPNWKRNGWKNSKKARVANKSLWVTLDAAIALHRHVEFSWVKAHSGLLHNEIADTLATRGVTASSCCPTNRFDVLPEDTEPDDVFDSQSAVPVITHTDEWDDESQPPTFSAHVTSLGLEQDDQQDVQELTFRDCSRNVLGNARAQASDDSDVQQGEDTLVMTWKMQVVPDEELASEVSAQLTFEFKPWSKNWTWPQALEADRREKADRLAFQQEFGWMREADHCLIGHGPHPVTWERLISNAEQSGDLH
jgi:ribonuclease HI